MIAVLLVSYDGTEYCGWQIQKNGKSIQENLQRAVQEAFHISVKIVGCSRTDAGVHAAAHVSSFLLPDDFSIENPQKIAFALNRYLPNNIRVLKSNILYNSTFHACHAAQKKRYRYCFYYSKIAQPLLERYAVRINLPVDIKKMQACAAKLEGEKDFKAMSAAGSTTNSTIRTIYAITIEEKEKVISIDICGNGFLYNMVRIIAGSLIAVGQNKLSIEQVMQAMERRDRKLVGKTMPAKGLTLIDVMYKEKLFIK